MFKQGKGPQGTPAGGSEDAVGAEGMVDPDGAEGVEGAAAGPEASWSQGDDRQRRSRKDVGTQ